MPKVVIALENVNSVKKTVNISECKKKEIDQSMSSEQVSRWTKVGDFKFWYTPHGKPCSDTIKDDSRIELNIAEEPFSCWV